MNDQPEEALMPIDEFTQWRKSTRSSPNNGNCVEVGFTADAATAGVRDTKDRSHGTLTVGATQWTNFLSTVKDGKLDL